MKRLTRVFHAADLQDLTTFPSRSDQLGVLERIKPESGQAFFDKLADISFAVHSKVSKADAAEDIRRSLTDAVPAELQSEPFYDEWVDDMAAVCVTFCDARGEDAVSFWIGSQRGSGRFHVDGVPLRALVTYKGAGTEWLPDEAADRDAFESGAPNEDIVQDPSAIRCMNEWDVAMFRGGDDGLLHRTPPGAMHGHTVMMRLDYAGFWDKIMGYEGATTLG